MRIHLIAAGARMPPWVEAGFDEYARRMPPELSLRLVEVPLGRRGKGADLDRLREKEGRKMLAAVPRDARIVALEVKGAAWDTPTLARHLQSWMAEGRDLALLVGGPEGLSDACRAAAHGQWSLSPLTLPHPLVRVVLAEQLYRAWSILAGHPYHR